MHSCLYSYTVIIQIEILLDAYAKVWALIWNGAYNLDKSAQSLVTERKIKGPGYELQSNCARTFSTVSTKLWI